ncbi:MAG: hypothetical protein ACD_3C00090G0002 [uncultured bacterium (gcode 4)]|uniref:Uncharacterized protein n=1 Tax=uncultured bacterium (gcode 4) TaxID=1234023 RepID=K2FZ04_9BACT|nr:MAG: hypothetical protein ACD_3C00090G0002 [uncultured bacterium (gcode 4)]
MSISKNCIIIHWCPDPDEDRNPETRVYDKHWIPWLKNVLESVWIKSEIPSMPEPWAPNYEAYKKEFERYPVNENSILIWHSCGCAFLVRWLWETGQKIEKLILVAPWKIPEEWNIGREQFYTYEIDSSIKDRTKEIIMFTSDDEEKDGKQSLRIFYESLGGKIIELRWHGHFILWHMWTEEFPELFEEIAWVGIQKKYD